MGHLRKFRYGSLGLASHSVVIKVLTLLVKPGEGCAEILGTIFAKFF